MLKELNQCGKSVNGFTAYFCFFLFIFSHNTTIMTSQELTSTSTSISISISISTSTSTSTSTLTLYQHQHQQSHVSIKSFPIYSAFLSCVCHIKLSVNLFRFSLIMEKKAMLIFFFYTVSRQTGIHLMQVTYLTQLHFLLSSLSSFFLSFSFYSFYLLFCSIFYSINIK